MKVFEEKQSFRQWWLLLIAVAAIGIPIAFIIDDLLIGNLENINSALLIASIILLPFIFLWNLSLHTKIDQSGITTWWEPFHFLEKKFLWKDLKEVYIRKYNSLMEYGGWGIRGLGKTRAYNVSGKQGIQLVNSNGNFLIGTQRPSEVETVIKKYKV